MMMVTTTTTKTEMLMMSALQGMAGGSTSRNIDQGERDKTKISNLDKGSREGATSKSQRQGTAWKAWARGGEKRAEYLQKQGKVMKLQGLGQVRGE